MTSRESRDATVAGVDGYRGGWVVATVGRDAVRFRRVPLDGIGEVLRDERFAAVAVDIPIGLPERVPRACDRLARARLPGRASTVFPAPRRAVLACGSYAEARATLRRLGGPSLSAQAWGIVAAVKEIDRQVTRAAEDRVVEAHPEVAFATMAALAGAPGPLPPKRSPDGRDRRRQLVSSWRRDAVAALDDAAVPHADGLDALACAWVAGRFAAGQADVLTDGSRDRRGLLMRIVV